MFILITGGSASGKSEYAESRLTALSCGGKSPSAPENASGTGKRIYVATMSASDEESVKRIERHRRMRNGKGFDTIEQYTHLEELFVEPGSDVLLECLSNLCANEMFSGEGRGDDCADIIIKGIEHILNSAQNLVAVTDNVFSDGIRYDKYTQRYMRLLADVNNKAAAMADEVIEVVCKIPLICGHPCKP